MTKEEKYIKWLENASEDLDTAECMLNIKKYVYVAFMCQQALEKLAKGIYVYNFDKEAPCTHNINIIFKDIKEIISSDKYKEYEILFSKLTSYYIIGRYDVYKQKISTKLDLDESIKLLENSKEAFLWLKSQQK